MVGKAGKEALGNKLAMVGDVGGRGYRGLHAVDYICNGQSDVGSHL